MVSNPTNIERSDARKVPMRVLVLGLPRTNTSSLISALRTLGYNPYTMRSLVTHPTDIPVWQEAANSTRFAPGLPLTINDVLSEHDAVADLPGCMFAEQLVKAYPDAKVILTTRKYADWEKSMRESIWVLFTWRLFIVCRVLGLSQMAPLMRLLHTLFQMHNGSCYGGYEARRAYEQHCEKVREVVAREQLLEIDADDESGWNELCTFLGREKPSAEYPRLQEDTAMRTGLEAAWWGMAKYMMMMVVLMGGVLAVSTFFYLYVNELRVVRDQWVLRPLREYLNA